MISNAKMLSFTASMEDSLKLLGLVRLVARLWNSIFRLPFVIAETLAVAMVFDVKFGDEYVRTHKVQERTLLLLNGDSVAIGRFVTNEISSTN